ncbi:hypothetical protein Q5762_05375 [Streptomyces sp. P9(2023)]|uniref:hypothetical protein n=1 Tax=Streptomyces sp. P9(2023) TaxID=3064394 RepID=UPI0028F3F2E8|nr:hypothetical protein [Streptomyces sp. P9(2023)]MDT9687789.1 hypothetical protein [Streptomyces sp. P9(2023)]
MEAELVALATAGATALVQQMVGDGWGSARTRVAAFFARRFGADEESVGAELEIAREELLDAERSDDEQAASDARAEALAEWRARMRRSLRDDPEAADELRQILAELTGEGGSGAPTVKVSNNVSAEVHHATVVQAGTIGTLSIGGTTGDPGATTGRLTGLPPAGNRP